MTSTTAARSHSQEEPWIQLRRDEPDLFHHLVKMHLSILLDLNTDDCDCSFVYDHAKVIHPAHTAPKEPKSTPSIAKKIFTPKKKASHHGGGGGGLHVGGQKGVMEGAVLTMEGVCQAYQLVHFLARDSHLKFEGIFRKHGNLKKQAALKERLNKGVAMDLDSGEFSVHECAAVLKSFLAELPEPLLTDAQYRAHCQVALLVKPSQTEEDQARNNEKKVQCLQLLFLLVSEPNYVMLKDLLGLLHKVAAEEAANKMSASNLGTMFAPLILCPRKLSAESIQSNHQLLSRAVAFMIANFPVLFQLPAQLAVDIQRHLADKASRPRTPPRLHYSSDDRPQSPVVNTQISFVDRDKTCKAAKESSTESSVAALYAHIQSMPESAQKRRLVQKLNDANGHGTPGILRSGANRLRHGGEGIKNLLTPRRSVKSNAADAAKIGRMGGSYNFQTSSVGRRPKPPSQLLHSFKRQEEGREQQNKEINQKLLSPQSSPAILVSPAAIDNLTSKMNSGGGEDEDNLDGSYVAAKSPAMKTFRPGVNSTSTPAITTPSLANKRAPPPVPQRVSSLDSNSSPITSCAAKMTTEMQASIMTPRSRRPVSVANSSAQLPGVEDEGFKIPQSTTKSKGFLPAAPLDAPPPPPVCESPCQPSKYNEDEPEMTQEDKISLDSEDVKIGDGEPVERGDGDDDAKSTSSSGGVSESDRYFDSLADEDEDEEPEDELESVEDEDFALKTKAYTSRSLKKSFDNFLQANNLELGNESSVLSSDEVSKDNLSVNKSVADNSMASVTSSLIGREAQLLLKGEMALSESMFAVMDSGENPDESTAVATPAEKTTEDPITPSVLVPVDVDSPYSESESEKENSANATNNPDGSYLSAKSVLSTYSSASTVLLAGEESEPKSRKVDIPLPAMDEAKKVSTSSIRVENSVIEGRGQSSRKRRSMTEIAELNPIAQRKAERNSSKSSLGANIYFETDL